MKNTTADRDAENPAKTAGFNHHYFSPFLVILSSCTNIRMWLICICVCAVCAFASRDTLLPAGAREEHQVSLSATVYLIPSRQGFSLILELGERPASPSDPATSLTTEIHTQLWDYTCTCGFSRQTLWNNCFVHYEYILLSLVNRELTGQKSGRKYRQNSQTENAGKKADSLESPRDAEGADVLEDR